MSSTSAVVTRADCSARCRSAQHTSELTSALCTSASQLAALVWVARHCHNPGRSRDTQGRTLAHVAAATGQTEVLEWLLQCREAQLNSKDAESGYSPLHRAAFHGQLRTLVWLLQHGANMQLLDQDGLTCLDHAVLDRPLHVSYDVTAPLDAYVWGTNSNFNLGLGNNTNRLQPDIVESFRKDAVSISSVVLQKFHSGFLTRGGQVLTCGHGRGGRLGHGSETMQLVPKGVSLPGPCVCLALGVDHSLFLLEGGAVLSCGDNSLHLLGHHPPPPLLLAPAPVTARSNAPKYPAALGVAAARFTSLFWSADSVYTWGLHGGQLGHIRGQERTVITPKLVSALSGRDNKISSVVASDGASLVLTHRGEVVALYEFTSKKLGQRQHNVAKMVVTGGCLDPGPGPGLSSAQDQDIDFKLVAGGGEALRVFILSVTGRVSVWADSRDNTFIPCVFSVSKEIIVKDLALHKAGLLLVTSGGEAWTGTHQPAARSQGAKGPAKELVKIKRLPNIHRGVAAACDAKGRNFCVLQVSPQEALTEIPEVSASTMAADLRALLAAAHLQDELHDVVCVAAGRSFPAHGFILASGAEKFAKQLKFLAEDEETSPGPLLVEVEGVLPDIFEQVLKFLYTKTCDLFIEGPCPITLQENNNPALKQNENILEVSGDPKAVSAFSVYAQNKKKKKPSRSRLDQEQVARTKSSDPLVLLQEAAKQLGVFGLVKAADCLTISEGMIQRKCPLPRPKLDFCSKNYPELQDVTIICDNEEEVYAHKCVLVARSEYFFSMFNSSWTESSSELSLPLDAKLVHTVLDYLYTDDCAKVARSEDVEFVSSVLVVADQFLLTRLKQICECQLSRLLTLKNAAELLQFSVYYLAEQLQLSAMQFICLNLAALLESRALESLERESWDKLDSFYRNSNPVFLNRRLGPIGSFPTADVIETEFKTDPITFEDLKAAEEMAKLNLKPRRRRISSGEKVKVDIGRNRLNSAESYSEESENDENEDKMSFGDLESEDENATEHGREELKSKESPTKETSPIDQPEKSFFSDLLNQKPLKIESSKTEKKKSTPGRVSQKERKRLSREAAEAASVTATSEEVSPSKTSWSGWGAVPSQPPLSSSSSLVEIMKMEVKTPSQQPDKVKSNKSEKKTSWKKIDLNASLDVATSSSPSPVKTNPWKLPVEVSPEKEKSVDLGKAVNKDETFQQIMKEDVRKEEHLLKVQSKPLHVTQIEEKAIEELKKFYNVSSCNDEIITVTRFERGILATPVWRRPHK